MANAAENRERSQAERSRRPRTRPDLAATALVLLAALTGALAACGGDDSESAATTAPRPASGDSTSTTTKHGSDCLAVDQEVLGSIGISAASGYGPSGKTGLNKDAYFVATADGAVWLTSADPSSGDLGLTLPLNQEARSASEVGTDVLANAPAFGGITATSPGAIAALECAGA